MGELCTCNPFKLNILGCTTPTCSKVVVYAPMGAERAESCPIAQSCIFVLPFCRSVWCYNNFVVRISVDLCELIAHWNCFVNEMCHESVRALAIFSKEEEKEWNLTHIQGTRFFNLIQFSWQSRCCTTQMANGFDSCNGTRFCIRWKIDILFNSASPRWIKHQSFTLCENTIARSTIHHLYTRLNWPSRKTLSNSRRSTIFIHGLFKFKYKCDPTRTITDGLDKICLFCAYFSQQI